MDEDGKIVVDEISPQDKFYKSILSPMKLNFNTNFDKI